MRPSYERHECDRRSELPRHNASVRSFEAVRHIGVVPGARSTRYSAGRHASWAPNALASHAAIAFSVQ